MSSLCFQQTWCVRSSKKRALTFTFYARPLDFSSSQTVTITMFLDIYKPAFFGFTLAFFKPADQRRKEIRAFYGLNSKD